MSVSKTISGSSNPPIPSCSRYVLVYTATSAPEGFSWVAYTMIGGRELEDLCCDMYGTWGDPHLKHEISFFCTKCEFPSDEYYLVACEPEIEGEAHVVARCSKSSKCKANSNVRILRRGRGPILLSDGDRKPVLEVEVIGDLPVSDGFVANTYFNLYAVDGGNQHHKTNFLHINDEDGSYDLEVEGGLGFVRGFRGQWERADWGDNHYDRHGLRIVDEHCFAREGWPPENWSSGSSDGEDPGPPPPVVNEYADFGRTVSDAESAA